MRRSLRKMNLAEIHQEGRRIGSPALCALRKPVTELDPLDADCLMVELKLEAEQAAALAKLLKAERTLMIAETPEPERIDRPALRSPVAPITDEAGLREAIETLADLVAAFSARVAALRAAHADDDEAGIAARSAGARR